MRLFSYKITGPKGCLVWSDERDSEGEPQEMFITSSLDEARARIMKHFETLDFTLTERTEGP